MREIVTTSRFERRLIRFVRQHPDLKTTVRLLMQSIASEDRASHVHTLHGKMKGVHAARITQGYRLIFVLEANAVTFIDIGSHDEVY